MNPLMRAVLRSPLHRLASNSLLLLHLTGRKSGRQYDIPVGYHNIDGQLTVFTNSPWRANIRDGADVEITLTAASSAGRASPRPRCHHRLPGRSASSARSPATASSWSPASGYASEPPTPGRSSPSTSRTPTSASAATAPRSPCTPHRAAPHHARESQDPHPATRACVQQLVSLSTMW